MATREELQTKLEELLGSKNVYYNPPTNLEMKYTAIRYTKRNINVKHADNKKYSKMKSYELIVISRKPDDPVIEKLMELPYCSHDKPYKSDNLNHDSFTLYW